VTLPSVKLSALDLAVASAAAAGASTLEAAAVISESSIVDTSAVRDLSATAPVYLARSDGSLVDTTL
jgi:hypothetical protein